MASAPGTSEATFVHVAVPHSTTRHLARRTPTGFTVTLCMRRVTGDLPLPSYAPLCRLCDEQERKGRPKPVPLR